MSWTKRKSADHYQNRSSTTSNGSCGTITIVWVSVLLCIVICVVVSLSSEHSTLNSSVNELMNNMNLPASFQYQQQPYGYPYGLVIPQGSAIALPSIRTSTEEENSIKREIYGGQGDKAHLGGFTTFDHMGVSPTLWNHMITNLGVKTLLDVGCGRGISTSYFILHGLEYVVCAEGSHDAVSKSVIPTLSNVPPQTKHEIVEHVFSRGPWWPSRTVDVALCVEVSTVKCKHNIEW